MWRRHTMTCSPERASGDPPEGGECMSFRFDIPMILLVFTSLCSFIGCSGGGAGSSERIDPDRVARTVYADRCASCHGATGAGDGPLARPLPVRPRRFQSASWQTSVTDETIAKVIVHGGAAVGLSPLMPPSPDLGSDRAVLRSLVRVVRSFKSPSQ